MLGTSMLKVPKLSLSPSGTTPIDRRNIELIQPGTIAKLLETAAGKIGDATLRVSTGTTACVVENFPLDSKFWLMHPTSSFELAS